MPSYEDGKMMTDLQGHPLSVNTETGDVTVNGRTGSLGLDNIVVTPHGAMSEDNYNLLRKQKLFGYRNFGDIMEDYVDSNPNLYPIQPITEPDYSATVDSLLKNVGKPVLDFLINQSYQNQSYQDALTSYDFSLDPNGTRQNIVSDGNGISGYRDRLEMLGLHRRKGTKTQYYYDNPYYLDFKHSLQQIHNAGQTRRSKILKQCAANANMLNRMLKKPTAGNAWTRHGVYGDSDIVVNPYKMKSALRNVFGDNIGGELLNQINGSYVRWQADNHELKTGDIVDIYVARSGHKTQALREGDFNNGNSHTGTILRTGPNKKDTYVVHYMGNGKISVDPIGRLLNWIPGTNKIVGIRRPGTKNHPYK